MWRKGRWAEDRRSSATGVDLERPRQVFAPAATSSRMQVRIISVPYPWAVERSQDSGARGSDLGSAHRSRSSAQCSVKGSDMEIATHTKLLHSYTGNLYDGYTRKRAKAGHSGWTTLGIVWLLGSVIAILAAPPAAEAAGVLRLAALDEQDGVGGSQPMTSCVDDGICNAAVCGISGDPDCKPDNCNADGRCVPAPDCDDDPDCPPASGRAPGDERVVIQNPARVPFKAIAKVDIGPDGGGRGSGVLVAPCTFLTNGHVVYNRKKDEFRSIQRVHPGSYYDEDRDKAVDPYGSKQAVLLATNTSWENTGESQYDYGAIFIESPFSNISATLIPVEFEHEPTFVNLSGYPSEQLPSDRTGAKQEQWRGWGNVEETGGSTPALCSAFHRWRQRLPGLGLQRGDRCAAAGGDQSGARWSNRYRCAPGLAESGGHHELDAQLVLDRNAIALGRAHELLASCRRASHLVGRADSDAHSGAVGPGCCAAIDAVFGEDPHGRAMDRGRVLSVGRVRRAWIRPGSGRHWPDRRQCHGHPRSAIPAAGQARAAIPGGGRGGCAAQCVHALATRSREPAPTGVLRAAGEGLCGGGRGCASARQRADARKPRSGHAHSSKRRPVDRLGAVAQSIAQLSAQHGRVQEPHRPLRRSRSSAGAALRFAFGPEQEGP